MNKKQSSELDGNAVVARAAKKAAKSLGISSEQISLILGSDSDQSTYTERALKLIQLYQALSGLIGANTDHMRAWMASNNFALRARPLDLIIQYGGLDHALAYLYTHLNSP
jgi:hypothetical protein